MLFRGPPGPEIQGVVRGEEKGVESGTGQQNQDDVLQLLPSGDIWGISQGKMGPLGSGGGKG